jgi:hypothetical protein
VGDIGDKITPLLYPSSPPLTFWILHEEIVLQIQSLLWRRRMYNHLFLLSFTFLPFLLCFSELSMTVTNIRDNEIIMMKFFWAHSFENFNPWWSLGPVAFGPVVRQHIMAKAGTRANPFTPWPGCKRKKRVESTVPFKSTPPNDLRIFY